jgi:ribosomal protein S18 acetylase RimI-like enzyme
MGTTTLQIEVLDLRHFSARQLKPLLEAECREWNAQLRWDYRTSADLLLQYLDARVLPGFVALAGGRICGYIFCVYEGNKAVVGDVYASAELCAPQTARDVERMLVTHMLEMLCASPQLDRIEAQMLLHPSGVLTETFLLAGFRRHERLFMECALAECTERNVALPSETPAGLELRPWSGMHFQEAGRLLQRAYAGHMDADINDQYRSAEGALRFLHNIIRFPGCGVFDLDASTVVLDAQGRLAAMLLCSRVQERVAHITQVCVLPEHQQRGLGRLLVMRCGEQLWQRGFEAMTLTVTSGNTRAVQLYERMGFRVSHRFDAVVWTGTAAGITAFS